MNSGVDFARDWPAVASRIRDTLKDKGIKASTIYKGMGRTRGWWSQIMSGNRNTTIRDLFAIASLLGVPVRDLFPEGKLLKIEPVSIDDQIEKKVLEILNRRKKQ